MYKRQILSNWYAFVGANPERAVEHGRALIELLDANPTLTAARPDLELGIVQSYLQRCIDVGMYDAYRSYADRLWNPTGGRPSRNIDVKRFYRAMTTELGYAVLSGDVSRVIAKLSYMHERFVALFDQIPEQSRISAAFLAARVCVEAGRVRDAGTWLRHVHAERDTVRTDLHMASRLLQMRMFVDDGDADVLRSAVRSLGRLATNRTLRSPRLDIVLSYFRRFADAHTKQERTKLRNECIARLGAVEMASPFDAVTSAGIDHWLGMEARSKTASVQPGFNY